MVEVTNKINKQTNKAGVRQGGVLSPYLFAIFVDDLLIKLQHSSLGCHISRNRLNAIMYADDLLLMSICMNDLQLMVDLCIEEFENLDMLINVTKSMYANRSLTYSDY